MKIQIKYINHLTQQGKKETSEKQLVKKFKTLQKLSNKNSEKLFQLILLFSTPIFRLHKLSIKKKKKTFREIPGFLKNKNTRISFALKLLIFNGKQNSHNSLPQKLITEMLSTSQKKSKTIYVKTNLQKEVLTKKHYFLYYRWN